MPPDYVLTCQNDQFWLLQWYQDYFKIVLKTVFSFHRKELRIHPFAWSTHWNALFHTWKNQGLDAYEYCSKIIRLQIVQLCPTSWCCFTAAFMQGIDGWWGWEEQPRRERNSVFPSLPAGEHLGELYGNWRPRKGWPRKQW